jgi:hypothetical protein
MENPTPQPHKPPALTQEPPNAFILICGPITTAAWLIIGGIALSSKAILDSFSADIVVTFCCAVYLIATPGVTLGLGLQWDNCVGPAFASGMLGFGIAGFCALVFSASMNYGVLFLTLGGMQAGWLVEWRLHPVGRLQGHQRESPCLGVVGVVGVVKSRVQMLGQRVFP